METKNHLNCQQCMAEQEDENNKKKCMQQRDNDEDQSSHNNNNNIAISISQSMLVEELDSEGSSYR